MLELKDGVPVIMTVNGRRYAICASPMVYADGTPTEHGAYVYCGALIDITDRKGIKVTDDCGIPSNHVVDDDGVGSIGPTL